MSAKNSKKTPNPDNKHDRSSAGRKAAQPELPEGSESSQSVLGNAPARARCAIAFGLALVWAVVYLRNPLWPTDVVAADADINGPRWFLLLVPDQILDGWLAGPVSAAGWLERFAVLLPAFAVLGVAWFSGRLLLRAWPPVSDTNRLEGIALATVAGLSLHSLVVLLAGLGGAVGKAWSGPLLALLTAGLAQAVVLLRKRWSDDAQAQSPVTARPSAETTTAQSHRLTFSFGLGCIAVGCLSSLLIARAMLPPAEYDVREYHLQAPKEWSQAGQIQFMPHNVYANMPMGAEMHALATMDWWRLTSAAQPWWWGALSGKVVLACFALLTATIIGCAVTRLSNRVTGIWTVAITLAMPAMIEGAALGLIESAVACFFAAAIWIVVAVHHPVSPHPPTGTANVSGSLNHAIGWMGFFAGSALACKYPALLFVILPLATAVELLPRFRSQTTGWQRIAYFSIGAVLACGPWLAKNAILAHNPVYPLVAKQLGGRTMDEAKIAQWNRGHKPGDYSVAEVGNAAQKLSWQWRTQSLLLFPLAGIAILCQWRSRDVRFAAGGVLLALLAWWIVTHRVPRFLIPSLPLVLLLAGLGWHTLREQLGEATAVTIVCLGCLLNGLMIGSPLLGDSRLAVDLSALREDTANARGTSRLAEHVHYANAQARAGDRWLLVGESAGFDFTMPLDYATTFDQSPLTAITANQPRAQWREAFQAAGWTHLLVHWGEVKRLRSSYGFDERITPELFDELEQAGVLRLAKQGLSGGAVDVYFVTAATSSKPKSAAGSEDEDSRSP